MARKDLISYAIFSYRFNFAKEIKQLLTFYDSTHANYCTTDYYG